MAGGVWQVSNSKEIKEKWKGEDVGPANGKLDVMDVSSLQKKTV